MISVICKGNCYLFLIDQQLLPSGVNILGRDEMEAVILENCEIQHFKDEEELKDYEIREI